MEICKVINCKQSFRGPYFLPYYTKSLHLIFINLNFYERFYFLCTPLFYCHKHMWKGDEKFQMHYRRLFLLLNLKIMFTYLQCKPIFQYKKRRWIILLLYIDLFLSTVKNKKEGYINIYIYTEMVWICVACFLIDYFSKCFCIHFWVAVFFR